MVNVCWFLRRTMHRVLPVSELREQLAFVAKEAVTMLITEIHGNQTAVISGISVQYINKCAAECEADVTRSFLETPCLLGYPDLIVRLPSNVLYGLPMGWYSCSLNVL